MRHVLPTLTIAAILVLGFNPASAQPATIVYVNSQEILAAAPGALAAQQTFEAELAGFETEAQQLQEELQRMQQDLQQQAQILSPEALQTRENELRQRAQQAQQRMQELDRTAAQRRDEIIQPVMDEITDLIETMRVENGWAIILDTASGAIVSADESLEVTDQVIARLEAAAGTGAASGN